MAVGDGTLLEGQDLLISNSLKFLIRHDLSLKLKNCEELWIEVFPYSEIDKDKKSIIVGVLYKYE